MTQSALILCCRSFQPWLSPRPTHRSANWQKGDEQSIRRSVMDDAFWMTWTWTPHSHWSKTFLFFVLGQIRCVSCPRGNPYGSNATCPVWTHAASDSRLRQTMSTCRSTDTPSVNMNPLFWSKSLPSMACALVHCMIMLSCKGSLISRHSRVVRYSLQLGVGVLVAMSCTDLASYCAGL